MSLKHRLIAGGVVGLIGYIFDRSQKNPGGTLILWSDPNLYVSVGLGAAVAYAFSKRS